MTKPFNGVLMLDFTQEVTGPLGSYPLALLGADEREWRKRTSSTTPGVSSVPYFPFG